MLIPLEDVKEFLGIPPEDTSSDKVLSLLISSAIETMQTVLGRNLVHGEYQDRMSYTENPIYVWEYPIESVLELEINGNAVAPEQYLVNTDGSIRLNAAGCGCYVPCERLRVRSGCGCNENMRVRYIAGYKDGKLPANMLLAVYGAVSTTFGAHKQSGDYGAPLKRMTVYDVGMVEYATGSDKSVGVALLRQQLKESLAPYASLTASLADGTHSCEYIGPVEEVTP